MADYGDLSTAGAVSQYGVGSGGALVPKSPPDVAAGKGPEGIAISPDGTSVYVVNGADGTVSQYDIKAGGLLAPKSTKTVDAGSAPFEIAVSPPPKFTLPGPKSHTVITSGPSGNTYSAPFFTFKSDIPNATFQCRIDNEPFTRCVTPYGRYDLKLGPHTFSVRSVDANGKPEAVPASRSFTLRTVTDTGSCLEYIPWDLFVSDRYLTARGCVPLKGTCPVGSVCTVTGTVHIREEDKNSSQYGQSEIFAVNGEPSVSCYTDAPTPSLTFRLTPDVPCPGTASWTILGGTQHASTDPTVVKCWALGRETSPGEQRGPDDQRLMTCSGRFTIAPVRSRFVSVGGLSIGGGLGGPGTLTVKAGGVHSASVVAARRKARPAFASIKKKVLKAGPVVLKLKPNTRARKLLRKRRALKVTLKFVFTPKGGGARKFWKEKLTIKLPGKPCTPGRRSGCPHGS